MMLHRGEEELIAALHFFIGTPRLAKRFVNVYRLLRVRASRMEPDFTTFTDYEHGGYRAALVLLAISIKCADVAPEILEDLYAPKGTTFTEWRSAMAKEYKGARLKALGTIKEGLAAVKASLAEHGGPPLDDTLATYSKWAREVGRYTFHWHIRADE
jgi:hypothetical protein